MQKAGSGVGIRYHTREQGKSLNLLWAYIIVEEMVSLNFIKILLTGKRNAILEDYFVTFALFLTATILTSWSMKKQKSLLFPLQLLPIFLVPFTSTLLERLVNTGLQFPCCSHQNPLLPGSSHSIKLLFSQTVKFPNTEDMFLLSLATSWWRARGSVLGLLYLFFLLNSLDDLI